MANMSYCRFENTLNDLVDCLDNIFLKKLRTLVMNELERK
jgi:hypothetical protein